MSQLSERWRARMREQTDEMDDMLDFRIAIEFPTPRRRRLAGGHRQT